MIPIVIASSTPFCGKTMLTLGLALNLKKRGFNVGYIRVIGKSPVKKGREIVDQDAVFIREALGLKEPLDVICPFILSYETLTLMTGGEIVDVSRSIMRSYEVNKNKDFLIIGGSASMWEGALLNINALTLIEKMNAKLLMVEPWRGMLSMDAFYSVRSIVKDRFAGGIINKVHDSMLPFVRDSVKPYLEQKGIKVFGVIKTDRVLESINVRHITEVLNGGVLCCENKLDEIVENFLIGAMDVETAMSYFLRTPNKAVITGGHRGDIIIAALETSTKCIILTGGLHPNDIIVGKAVSKGIPLISVVDDTFKVVEKIERVIGCAIIREKSKIDRCKQLIKSEFDMERFLEAVQK